jgi:hypothetical protein
VIGLSALKAVEAEVCPVPPLAMAIVVPFHTPVVMVPTDVREEVTTLAARVVPVRVPAGATTALVDAAVMRPLALTVKLGIAVEDPKDPTLPLTVARVNAAEPGPDAVASPVRAVIAAGAPVIWLYGRESAERVVNVEFEVALMFPAVRPEAVPVMLVPTKALGVPNAGVTSVGLVASTTAPEPVVEAAEIAVPSPCRIPVMVVVSVRAGVWPPEELPAKPLAVATEMEVTGAVPLDAAVIRPLALTVIEALVKDPTLPLTVARVKAAAPGPVAVPSPVKELIAAPEVLLKAFQSVLERYPLCVASATCCAMDVPDPQTALVPPVMTMPSVPASVRLP